MTTKRAKPRAQRKATPKPTAQKASKKRALKTTQAATKAAGNKPASKPPGKKLGRPTDYTAAKGKRICRYVREGYTLRQIEAQTGMPTRQTIIAWLGTNDDFLDQYARAHEIHALVMGDEIVDLVDDSRNDWIEREGKDGKPELVIDREHLERLRMRVEARKWLMIKMAPKRFGNRVALTDKMAARSSTSTK